MRDQICQFSFNRVACVWMLCPAFEPGNKRKEGYAASAEADRVPTPGVARVSNDNSRRDGAETFDHGAGNGQSKLRNLLRD